MKLNILKTSFFTALAAGLLSGCVNGDDYPQPEAVCFTETPTKTVAEIYALAPASSTGVGTPILYTGDDIIEAYVTSSDEASTFYKSVSMQTLDGSLAFSIPVDLYNIYSEIEPGRKVYVHLNGRQFSQTYGSLIIGDKYVDPATPDEDPQIGRLVPEEFRRAVKPSCEKVDEEVLVQRLTIAEALNDNTLNKLIEFENVQFNDEALNKTYYDNTNEIGGATNHNLVDANGNTIIFRTSSFAKFGGHRVPNGSGKIRGVLTKYQDDYQFLARTEDDIQLTEDRLEIDLFPPIVGTAIDYLGAFTETFESYVTTSPGNRTFPKYINDPVIGSRYWANTTFGGNKYIQMTSFGGTPEANRTLFYIPVDMTAANGFSFQSKSGFTNGPALKVYYSLDYVPGQDVNDATLIDITSSFTISPGQSSGYPATFTNSGTYAIPAALTGNGFFIFEYVGNGDGGVTSTIQIDNVTVN